MGVAARNDGSDALALRSWAERDRSRALHAADGEAIVQTEAARSLVVELFTTAHERDLFSACARLGGLMAEAGASPSLAAGTINEAARALDDARVTYERGRVTPARASLVEGYVATLREASLRHMLGTWEYPACTVPLEGGAVAVACGYPTDDAEALAAWASRVAGCLVKARVRTAVLAGPDAARSEITNALELVGVRVRSVHGDADATSLPRKARRADRGWLRWPWRR